MTTLQNWPKWLEPSLRCISWPVTGANCLELAATKSVGLHLLASVHLVGQLDAVMPYLGLLFQCSHASCHPLCCWGGQASWLVSPSLSANCPLGPILKLLLRTILQRHLICERTSACDTRLVFMPGVAVNPTAVFPMLISSCVYSRMRSEGFSFNSGAGGLGVKPCSRLVRRYGAHIGGSFWRGLWMET